MPDFSQERLLRLFCKAPKALWRHDVDISLRAAERMARFAQVAGVRSTFFLMLSSDHYNLLSDEGSAAVETIWRCGHMLGVHCDLKGGDPEVEVRREWRILDNAYPGVFGFMVSFHMPRQEVLWRDFDGFQSAYGSRWKGRYLSDSRREFGADKEALVSNDMQVNLHPEHWFS